MSAYKDLTNQVFGNLTVIRFSHFKNFHSFWYCKCICGKTHIAYGCSLKNGDTKSCGCIKRKAIIDAKTTHGLSHIPEYMIWQKMVYRCYNVNDKSYKNYGGRGIQVSASWRDSFENFFKDMGYRPSKFHSLDREDNNGDYSKDNCKWVTRAEQNRNTRKNKWLIHDGREMILQDWAKELNVSHSHLQFHLKTKSMAETYNHFSLNPQ